ncbi:helicase-associated domain-containing protein [Frankia gtarii]|uniref:helicase-associated domain-containing protein n=1 Tax=Frankia gtarii TaxID=2950102 RepID=UPI0021C0F78D|nr:helicase-associated domain-containing protein [Frankia gtarii]
MPSTPSFATHLAGLGPVQLGAVLRARPDVLVEPLPRGFEQLAQRLTDARSLSRALTELDRDSLQVGVALALLPGPVTVDDLATLLDVPRDAVRAVVDGLFARGLAWPAPAAAAGTEGGGSTTGEPVIRLLSPLHHHWSEPFTEIETATRLASAALVEDVRTAVRALGEDPTGLRKPELVTLFARLLADPVRVAALVAELPAPARELLTDLWTGVDEDLPFVVVLAEREQRAGAAAMRALVRAGLMLPVRGLAELPREVAVAAWITEHRRTLTGPPAVPRPVVDPAGVRSSAQAAAQDAVRSVTALLDEAAAVPIPALKRGGIGGRERLRLAKRLSLPPADLPVWIDLTATAGLLIHDDAGYVPGPEFTAWREAPPSRQWAPLALAWYVQEHAPSGRELDDERDIAPPLPIESDAGLLRGSLLRAADGGRSVRLTAENIDWFFPLDGYPDALRTAVMAATIREAELLGVVTVDVLSELGETLLTSTADLADLAGPAGTFPSYRALTTAITLAATALGDRCAELLPESRPSLILQSDLTAVVSGPPTAAMAQVLRATAEPESRGAAGTWRFTPASVRAALDAGWTADELLDELRAMADHTLPQALDYLVTDVARRHGHVRVRGLRSAILGDEPTTTELLHTRVLAKLSLARLAPTVLSSPEDPDTVLVELRRAGFYPVAEDATGAVIVPSADRRSSGPATRRQKAGPPPGRQSSTASPGHSSSAASSNGSRGRRTDPPGTSPARAGGGRPRAADSAPRRVTPEELVTRLLTDADEGVPPPSPLVRELAGLNDRLNDGELTLLAEAVTSRGDVVITYRDKNGKRTVRRITINAMFGRWLDAWCHLRNDDREFAIANIQSISPAG